LTLNTTVSTATSKLEQACFAAYMAILVWAPLPFASNRVWAWSLLCVLIYTLLCVWLLLYARGRAQIAPLVWRRARLPLALLMLVQLWVLLQITALPRYIIEALSPQAYAWHIKEGWLTLSLDPTHTHYYLLRGTTFTAGFFLTIALVNSQQRVKTLLQVLVFSGTFQAAYGAFMVLSGLNYGFLIQKYVGQSSATGTFVNRNHLGGYLNMCLAAGIGLLLSRLASTRSANWKERIRRWLRLLLSSKIRLRVYLAVMVIALVLTRGRMANIAFFTSLGLAGAIALYTGRRFSWRVMGFLASLFIVDMLILGKWFGFDKVVRRLEQTDLATEKRAWSNEYTLDYIAQFPLTGSGGGSFYGIFPNFQAPDLTGFHDHAHNDYLQFAAELGIPAALVLVVFVCLALWQAVQLQRTRHTPLYKGAGFAVTMTVLWAAIHSTADFNLQIPANALTFVTILALAFICRGLPGGRRKGG
jgi:O-antigen ligase